MYRGTLARFCILVCMVYLGQDNVRPPARPSKRFIAAGVLLQGKAEFVLPVARPPTFLETGLAPSLKEPQGEWEAEAHIPLRKYMGDAVELA